MKRIALALLLSGMTLAIYAQRDIKVNFKGSKPNVVDFAKAAFVYLNADDDEPGDRPWRSVEEAIIRHSKGLPQLDDVTLIIDVKNGYIMFEQVFDEDEDYICRMEICYWNESDGKHKLIAFNNTESFAEGRPVFTETHGLDFYRYNNATKHMVSVNSPGFKVDYGLTYSMPRIGKNIEVTHWDYENGTNIKKTLKWNGRKFSF